MKLSTFSPLLILPIATFVNLQSCTVPLVRDQTKSPLVLIFSSLSLAFGIIGMITLAIRMLEKKIKWMTRLMMISSFLQGVLALLSLILFHTLEKDPEESYTEAIVYKSIAGVSSLIASLISLYNYLDNVSHHQVYVWVAYSLSNEQRQFILLTICSLTYISLVSGIYCFVESWAFDISLYWCVSTFLTVGFGDISPKTWLGMFIFPPLSFIGVLILGSNIYAMRNLFLEGLAIQLASQYSKFLELEDEVEIEIEQRLGADKDHIGSDLNRSRKGQNDNNVLGDRENPTSEARPIKISDRSPQNNPVNDWIDNHQLGVSLDSTFERDKRAGPSRIISDVQRRSVDSYHTSHSAEPGGSNFLLPPPTLSRDRDEPKRRNLGQRTMTISRSSRLPSVTIVANQNLKHRHIQKVTRDAIIRQTMIAIVILWLNIIFGAAIFAFYENWSFGEGLYFSYCSILTIGFGDYVLKSFISKTIFIWFIFIAIGSSTYLISMMSELAFDQWKIAEESIAKRVDRYETKARWKKQYCSPSMSPSIIPSVKGKGKPADDFSKVEKVGFNRTYAVSVSLTSPSALMDASLKSNGQDQESSPLLPQYIGDDPEYDQIENFNEIE